MQPTAARTPAAAATAATDKRPEVQALRAVAALLVVLYHLWPGRLPGGYVGVDVFFVISGFLITAHLLREASSTGRIQLVRFWARRARRLLPAAFLVLAASAAATFIWLPKLYWEQNFREIIASGLYFQNWRLALDAVDYLAAENATSTAQHYWTLSVEEQFYLVWPLLILAALGIAALMGRRRSLVPITVIIGVGTVASFAYSYWLTDNSASFAYFSTPARAWEFGAGSLLALAFHRLGSPVRRRVEAPGHWRAVLSVAGFATLAYVGLTYSSTTPFPGTAALLPVIGTVAIIAAGAPPSRLFPHQLVDSRPVQLVGDISYSLYLWHWPPIVVLPYVLGHPMGFLPRLGILVGALVAAYLTKRFVEDPIRFGRRFGLRRSSVTFGLSAVFAAALVAVSVAGTNAATRASDRAEAEQQKILSDAPRCFGAASMVPGKPCNNPELDGKLVPDTTAVRRDFGYYRGCWSSNNSSAIRDCTFGDATDKTIPHVVLIGDSHARALLPAFVKMAKQGKVFVTAQLKGSCAWSKTPPLNDDKVIADACATWRVGLTKWLDENQNDIDAIVTTSLVTVNQFGTEEQRIQGYVDAWKPYASQGIPIIAFKDNPYHQTDPNDCLATETTITATSCDLDRKDAFPNFDAVSPAVKRVPGVKLFDFTSFYCSDTTCPSVIGGVNVYRDAHHVTGTYTTTMAPYIYDRMRDDGLLKIRRTD